MLLLRAALLLSATPLAAALSTLSRQGVLQGRVSATQAPTGGYESCVRLAARLSDAYTATDPFEGDNSSELGQYLSQHGVLFTMCEKYENCSARARQGPGGTVAQWSGSWVNKRTGFLGRLALVGAR